jgi:hypothetical protein
MQVAGISSRTRLAAQSRPGCRSSSCCKLCASAPRACVRCRSACAQSAWCTCGRHGLGVACGARIRRAVGTTGSVRPSGGGSTAWVLRGSRCGRMRQTAAGPSKQRRVPVCSWLNNNFFRGAVPTALNSVTTLTNLYAPSSAAGMAARCAWSICRGTLGAECAVRCAGDSASIT